MTTQTKTETPDNGQSELERLADDLRVNLNTFIEEPSYLSDNIVPIILTALTTATAPLKAEIERLFTACNKWEANEVEILSKLTAAHAKIRELEAHLHGKCEGQS